MPGITSRGFVRITPYKSNKEDLESFEKIFLENEYNTEGEEPSTGFIGIPNKDGLSSGIEIEKHKDLKILLSRFTTDIENRYIKKIVKTEEEFNSLPYYMKYAPYYFDILLFNKRLTYALISSIAFDKLSFFERICFNGSCFTDNNIIFNQTPDEFTIGTDLLLWLCYIRIKKNGQINDKIKLRDIAHYYSKSTHTISYTGNSSYVLKELALSIWQKRPIERLKIWLGISNNVYSFRIYNDGRTEINANETTAYDEMEDYIKRREMIIYDLYNDIIPLLKEAYENDKEWAQQRDIFRKEMYDLVAKK